MRRWLVPLVAFVVVGAMLVVGLAVALRSVDRTADPGPPTANPASSPEESPAPDASVIAPPEAALAEFYAQRLDWEPCEAGFECAALEVPMDYEDPGGDTIDLALLRRPAGDPAAHVGSLVVNPGGPGVPGTDYAAAADRAFRRPLLDAFDIVGFDPRGTGESSPVDCLSDEELDAYLAEDPDPDTAAEEADYVEWTERIGEGCVEHTGEIIGHVTTIEAARDMDVLRAALGEERLTYLGASYGTELGATYAELFPQRTGRLLLDGAVDASLSRRDEALGQARGFQRALEAYVENCVEESSNCFLGDSVDEGLQRIRDFLDDVDAEPLPTGTDRELTEGRALYGIIWPLYVRDYWFLLSGALRQGFSSDGAGLLQLADLYSSRNPAGGYRNNTMEAFYAIGCLDDPSAIDASQVQEHADAFEEASPTLGRSFAWGLTACEGWVVESTPEPVEIRAEGAAPIVVVGTTRDPATPYQWAVALADQLESGVFVSRDGDGHTGYNSGNACVDEAVEEYLIEGTVPEDGLSC
jgi:pimeloyl-ACP methyl ester carboxylesterase